MESEFTVTVDPVNDAPTLDVVGDVAVERGSPEQTVNLTGISAGPANESGRGSRLPRFRATRRWCRTRPCNHAGNAGTLTFTPVDNASGTATMTVTVIDNGGTSNGGVNTFVRTFTVTVGQVGRPAGH